MWPDHPSYTREAYTDPEVFDVDRPVQKRMPHDMEIQFEHMRGQGFFPGDPAVARTHFIDIMRLWRGRIRGKEGEVWDATRKEWQTASRFVFFLEQMKAKGLPFPDAVESGVSGVTDLSDQDVFLAGLVTIEQMEAGEVNAETVQSVLGLAADEYTFVMERGQVGYQKKDGSEEMSIVDADTVRTYHDDLFNWPAIIERHADNLQSLDRQAHRTRVVGHRVYLPNVTIKLTRNFTPPGQPYDPYIATFRIPPSMTKQDLRSYLKAVYNLDVSFVRTVVYWGEVVRDQRNGQRHRQKGGEHNYKKAIVGLYEPFHYPDDVKELRAISRAQGRGDQMYIDRMNSLNSTFYIREQKDFRRKLVQAVYKRSSYGHRSKGEGQSRVRRGSLTRPRYLMNPKLIPATHPCQDHGAPQGPGERDRGRGAQAPARRQGAGRCLGAARWRCSVWIVADKSRHMLHAHAFIRNKSSPALDGRLVRVNVLDVAPPFVHLVERSLLGQDMPVDLRADLGEASPPVEIGLVALVAVRLFRVLPVALGEGHVCGYPLLLEVRHDRHDRAGFWPSARCVTHQTRWCFQAAPCAHSPSSHEIW